MLRCTRRTATGALDTIQPADAGALDALADVKGKMTSKGVCVAGFGFLLTNPIARASGIMAECSSLRAGQHKLAAAE